MLLTVKETARALGIEFGDVYYLVSMSRLPAVRIRGAIRLMSESVEGFCAERERENASKGGVPRYHGYGRCHEIIENLKKNSVPYDGGRNADRMEGRGRRMEFCQDGCSRIPRKELHDIGQLYFDFYESA